MNYRVFNIRGFLLLFFWLACVLFSLLPLYGNVSTNTTVDRLSVKGAFLVNEQGEKIVLKGVSLGWHNWWPRFYKDSVVKTLKEQWNCTLVRAAMGVEPEGGYLTNPEEALKLVTSVADAAIANGMYVIIDWHSHGLHMAEAKAFFSRMALRYKDVPNVIYEIFNEPVNDTWADIKQYAEDVIACIRAIDDKALILVGTPHWDQDIHLAADNPIINAHNIMYTLHFYAATHQEQLRERAEYALKKDLPLFVSECAGMEASGDGDIDLIEWNIWIDWMKQYSISWAVWSLADKEETCSMLESFAPDSDWSDQDLKEWGRMVKNVLVKE